MPLNIQIQTLIFSFFFGIFFSLFLNLNKKIIYCKNKFIKYLGTFLIIIISMLLYFIGLRKIYYAAFHPYLILTLILGYILENILNTKIKKVFKE